MPINLYKCEFYFYPFDNLFNYLSSIPTNNSDTIEHWRILFKKYDILSIDELEKYINTYGNNYHEYFQYTHHYEMPQSDYIYHFDIGKILMDKPKRAQLLSINKLKRIAAFDIPTDNYISKKPIVICKFITPYNRYLVIDGNHSLANSIYKRKRYVKTLIRNPVKDDFIFTIDYVMYILNNFLYENPYITQKHQCLFDSLLY